MNLVYQNVCAHYPNTKKLALNNISFQVNQADTLFILGPSGAGKTSILSALYGNLKITQGMISFNGVNLAQMKPKEHKRFIQQIGYLSQDWFFFKNDTVFQALKRDLLASKPLLYQVFQFLKIADRELILQTLASLGILEKAFVQIAELSQGQKQRVKIAQLLIKKPKLILADEPTTGLDIKNATSNLKMIQQLGTLCQCPVLVISHDLEIIKQLQIKVLAINQGQMKLLKKVERWTPQLIESIYGHSN